MDAKQLNQARIKVGAALRKRRLELNYTPEQVAERCGMGVDTINRAEGGLFWLGLKQYLIICDAIHLPPSEPLEYK